MTNMEFMKENIRRVAIVRRITIEEEGVNKEVIDKELAAYGNKVFEEYEKMSEETFLLECFLELAKGEEKLREMKK